MIDCKTKGGFLLGVVLKLFGCMRVRLSVNRNVQLNIILYRYKQKETKHKLKQKKRNISTTFNDLNTA